MTTKKKRKSPQIDSLMKRNEENGVWLKIMPRKNEASQFIFYGRYIYRRLTTAILFMETEYKADENTLSYYQNRQWDTDNQIKKYTLPIEKEMRRIYSLKENYKEILKNFCNEVEQSVSNRPVFYQKVFMNHFIAGVSAEQIAVKLNVKKEQVEKEIKRIKREFYDERPN
jgi:DNA-directed RNA polymerase specialized sigma24 family protein